MLLADASTLSAFASTVIFQPGTLPIQTFLLFGRRPPRVDHYGRDDLFRHGRFFLSFRDDDSPRRLLKTLDLTVLPPAECRSVGDPVFFCVLAQLHVHNVT